MEVCNEKQKNWPSTLSIIFLLNLVVLDGPSFESQAIGTVIAGSSSWNIKKFLPH